MSLILHQQKGQQWSAISKQVEEYIEGNTASMSQNPAKYWKENQQKIPFYSRLAKDVLGEPSSSAPAEDYLVLQERYLHLVN